jgi:hypothetical protein
LAPALDSRIDLPAAPVANIDRMRFPGWSTIALLLAVVAAGRAPAVSTDGIDAAIERSIRWLENVRAEPFTGSAADLRVYTVEVECWHRLSILDTDPDRRSRFERVTADRLAEVLDRARLEQVLSGPDGTTVFTELLVLAARCREHGIDPAPIREVLLLRRRDVLDEAGRVPPSIRALYAAYLPAVGLQSAVPIDQIRRDGMRARRPCEVDLGLADVYYLTHEIFADCDYGFRPLPAGGAAEQAYLLRVLPFYTLLYAGVGNLDIVGELLVCMRSAALRNTFGYQEGIRVLLERQNPDGSYGNPNPQTLGRPVRDADRLHATMNAITALGLERQSLRNPTP